MNPDNPAFVNASKMPAPRSPACPRFGNPNSAPAGSIEVQSGNGPKGGPGGNGGAGAVIGNGGGQAGSGSNTFKQRWEQRWLN